MQDRPFSLDMAPCYATPKRKAEIDAAQQAAAAASAKKAKMEAAAGLSERHTQDEIESDEA